jgi:hypothetical protein
MTESMSGARRAFAAGVAAAAWTGVGVQFAASTIDAGSAWAAAWHLLQFFTIITNLALAVTFTGVALGRSAFAAPTLLGGVTLAIVLVGVVYSLLLAGTVTLTGGAKFANVIMHYVVPILTPLFWLTYAPKGRLRTIDPLIWSIYPLTYLAYALARGSLDGHYPYPFMDVGKIGLAATAINVAAIAAGFLLAGYLMLLLDRAFGRRADEP